MTEYWTTADDGTVLLNAEALDWQGDPMTTGHEKMILNTEVLREHPLVKDAHKPRRSPKRCQSEQGFVQLIEGYVFSDSNRNARLGGPAALLKAMSKVVKT